MYTYLYIFIHYELFHKCVYTLQRFRCSVLTCIVFSLTMYIDIFDDFLFRAGVVVFLDTFTQIQVLFEN
jgi:hypothetical protein